ncbi:EutN/CcmL family microcompartment protein [Alkaliphilus serpentinus]|uniref:Ethanolamine utilization protein EutN n=1 Tax=Alkaliphilus serpentinus TaxID=1482731 RepID=A0A833HLD4_9FIRM|nr:EutN/CcmL family microcompartment protein [Alkaliphilus serpentinus]KAB3525608.1 ethanolamine utilization protein EutN [Alkaliphilus serpentinus]
MVLGKVVGNIWATRKEASLNGMKFLVVKPIDYSAEADLATFIAADNIGAGIGETVLVTKGSSARKVLGRDDIPVDAMIVGIVDSEEVELGLIKKSGDGCGFD